MAHHQRLLVVTILKMGSSVSAAGRADLIFCNEINLLKSGGQQEKGLKPLTAEALTVRLDFRKIIFSAMSGSTARGNAKRLWNLSLEAFKT